MIDTQNYSDLTNFVHDEFSKILQNYGLNSMPSKCLKKLTSGAIYIFEDYQKLIRKQNKMNIKIEWAITTMPHSWIWKLFHASLWKKVQVYLKNKEEQCSSVEEETVSVDQSPKQSVPVVVQPVDMQAMNYPGFVYNPKQN